MVNAFEGNTAETSTMLPTIRAFMQAHQLPDVTVVADAGMVSAANQQAIEAAGLSFILGARIPEVPYLVAQWRKEHPGEESPDGQVFTQPWAGLSGQRRDQVYHRLRDSIDAHLTIVFAALAVSRWIEDRTGWSIRKFVRTARRYRTVEIHAGAHTITAADPLPDDLRDTLHRIHDRPGAH